MATKAFLLVETAVGRTRDVANTLRDLDGIESVDVVTGPYDIIAVISGEDMSVVGGLVTEKIHTVVGRRAHRHMRCRGRLTTNGS